MKKPQANFVVEYKGARRKIQPKANSIWGNVDLRSYADDAASLEAKDGSGDIHAALPEQTSPDDVPPISANTPASEAEEGPRSDRENPHRPTGTAADDRLGPPTKSEKEEPIAEKAGAEIGQSASSVCDFVAPAAELKRRVLTKPARKAKRSEPLEQVSKNVPSKGAGSHPAKTTASVTAFDDEMEDLLKLEQENRVLRKLLVEKLRSENALLRARLGLD